MRTIESKMIQAIRQKQPFGQGNTTVTQTSDYRAHVYLHGNHIAYIYYGDVADDFIATPNVQTLRQWATSTTKSRLRALGIDVCQRRNRLYIGDEHIMDLD